MAHTCGEAVILFMLYCLPQVFVEPGQSVEEGETLIVMEAMKMEV